MNRPRSRWYPIISILVLVTLLVPLTLSRHALAADESLVFEALQALQTHYVDPVDPVKVLNAAIEALRAQLSSAGVAAELAEIPAGTAEGEARRLFADRFATATAAAAGRLTQTQLAYAAIQGMTESFRDSHTGFLTPQQNLERRQQNRGQAGFTGVGVVLLPKDGKFFVWAVIPGMPAEAAGIREFDRVLRVNDISTGGMTIDQVSGMIRGSPGTEVTLTLQRPGAPDPVTITVTRAPIVVPPIFKAELLEGGIGYIRLYQFVDRTGRDFRAALSRLLAQRMRALVLDLRGNGGGFLTEVKSVMDALLPSGVPVYTEIRQGGQVRVIRASGAPLLPSTVPMIVLVDEGSASAAELLAAAIKENKRGQLVGEKTAGAVEASIMVDLSDGSALSVTTFRLATGRGVRLEGVGVEVDVPAPLTTADLESGQDPALGAALRLARQGLAQRVP